MKVGIIGAGSIGLLYAACLAKNLEVTLYTRTVAQADNINQKGISILNAAGQTVTSPVTALPFSEWSGLEDVTIITVKQYQLPPIIEKIHSVAAAGNLLFLQNGMGHIKLLETLRGKNVFVGTVEHGALRENLHTVRHNGIGNTNVAVFSGESAPLENFISSVPNEFPVFLQSNYHEMLINKLIINAAINPLTAILRVKNGALIENQFYLQALTTLFAEIAVILNLDASDAHLKQILEVCRKTAENRSSMLKDLEAGRLTEIDAILGYLLEEARKQEKQAPQAELLYHFIKGKEQDERGHLS